MNRLPWVLLGLASAVFFAFEAAVGIRLIGRDGRPRSTHAPLRALDWVGAHLDQSKVGSLKFVWPFLLGMSAFCVWFAVGNVVG